jgi:hypothetical protein
VTARPRLGGGRQREGQHASTVGTGWSNNSCSEVRARSRPRGGRRRGGVVTIGTQSLACKGGELAQTCLTCAGNEADLCAATR